MSVSFPLHIAAKGNDLNVVKKLIEEGYDINEKDWTGVTALHEAAAGGHLHIVKYLIDKGANIDARGAKTGSTPLHLAVENEHYDVAYHLIEQGARMDIKDDLGRTAKHKSDSYKMTQLFSLYINPNRDRSNSITIPPTPEISILDEINKLKDVEKISPEPEPLAEKEQTPEKSVLMPDISFTEHQKYTEISYMVEGLGIHHYVGMIDANGKKSGRGELIYPNGITYEGDFVDDKRHGFGKLMQATGKLQAPHVAIGQWVNDQPSEDVEWKITRGPWHYFGYISVLKIMKKRSSKRHEEYLLTIDHLRRHSYGELHDIKSNFKYFGSFENDKRDGFGVCTFGNGDRYYGVWRDDLLHDYGTYVYKTGNVFQGKFSKGHRKGKGTLFMPSGDAIEGVWDGDKISSAVLKRGSPDGCPTSMLYDMSIAIADVLKVRENEGVIARTYNNLAVSTVNGVSQMASKWKEYFNLHKDRWDRNCETILNTLEKCDLRSADVNGLYFEVMWAHEDGFMRSFVDFFLVCFHGSYYMAGHTLRKRATSLLLHAKDDVKSFVDYIEGVLGELFTKAFDILIKREKNDKKRIDILNTLRGEACQMVPSSIIRHVLAKAHNTIFPLYEINYQEADLIINQKIDSVAPSCSLSSMGVAPKFEPPLSQQQQIPFAESIAKLEKITSERTVVGKIDVLSHLRRMILTEMKNNRKANRMELFARSDRKYEESDSKEDEQWQPGADDFVGVYSYVFLKSRIRNHHAQFHYINDWRHEETHEQPVSHLLTFYEGFLDYVKDLDPNLKTEEGEFISTHTIAKSLERSIQYFLSCNKNQTISLHWLPLLLSHIGLEIGGLRITNVQANNTQAVAEDALTPIRTSGIAFKRALIISENSAADLSRNIIDNFDTVQNILSRAQANLGFIVELANNKKEVIVEFSRTYPSHVYTDLSLLISRFVIFELEE